MVDARICSNVNIVMAGKSMIIILMFIRQENAIKKIVNLKICVHSIMILLIKDKYLKKKKKWHVNFQTLAN